MTRARSMGRSRAARGRGARLRALPLGLLALAAGACASAAGRGAPPDSSITSLTPAAVTETPPVLPRTRAERSGYAETSSHADVLAFLDSLRAAGLAVHQGVLGTTTEGRALPYVVASRPLVRTPDEARALGRPVVFVQGNIHAGEVEGKEALQALVRDLLAERGPNVLDSIVLVALPIYNADGNERLGAQARQRSEQHGPALVGQRPNAQGLDLNRDYVKAEAPETRAALAFLNAWDPHLFVDLHTTNGSWHGYALTYSPSLYPEVPGGRWAADSLLPDVRRRVRGRGFETYDYGNFSEAYGGDDPTSARKDGWFTYDHRPRFGTNYHALRNRVAVLSEAFSHDPFERRVASTYAFVAELLSAAAEHGDALRALAAREDAAGLAGALDGAAGTPVAGRLTTTPVIDTVLVHLLARTGDTLRTEPGLRPGFRRTGQVVPVAMPVHVRFDATTRAEPPAAYALPDSATAARLALHGVAVRRLTREWRGEARRFVPDSVARGARPFQGHREVAPLTGRWETAAATLPAGTWIVPGRQRLARLALVLLHPQSDDGLVTWNAFDAALDRQGEYPVLFLDTDPREE